MMTETGDEEVAATREICGVKTVATRLTLRKTKGQADDSQEVAEKNVVFTFGIFLTTLNGRI